MNFRDRDTALRMAREKGDTIWQGSKLALFPDFTPMVQEARRKYNGVKATLRNLGLRYGMLYPARLRVDADGQVRVFDTPAAAQTFCQTYKQRNSPNASAEPCTSSPPRSGSTASADLFATGGPD